jgi:hypothetical protein
LFVPPELERLDRVSAEVIVCASWQDERPSPGLAGLLDWRLAGKLSRLQKETFASGALGEVLWLQGRPRLPFDKVLVLGMGPRAGFGPEAFKVALERLTATLEGLRVRRAVVELPGRGDDAIAPELAAELVLACVGRAAHDAWWLVEGPDAEARIVRWEAEERLRARNATQTQTGPTASARS